MAGFWDIWKGDDETISCVTILTTDPIDVMKPVHDRMPVVLPQNVDPTGSLQPRTPARNCASRIRRTI
jgi:putative SOS response-associated peptidase YedK